MKKIISLIGLIISTVLIASSCSSRSVLPDTEEVQVSRKTPAPECKELGLVTGQTLSKTGTAEDALADLKKTAAQKGATHVKIQQYSGLQTSVRGEAYECP